MKKVLLMLAVVMTAQFASARYCRYNCHRHDSGDAFVIGALLGSLFTSTLLDDPYYAYYRSQAEGIVNNIQEFRLTGVMSEQLSAQLVEAQAITKTSEAETLNTLEAAAWALLN